MHRRAAEAAQVVGVPAVEVLAAVPEVVQQAEARPVVLAWAAAGRAALMPAGPTEPEWAARPEATQWVAGWEPGQAPHPI